jgi:hypothetical protein
MNPNPNGAQDPAATVIKAQRLYTRVRLVGNAITILGVLLTIVAVRVTGALSVYTYLAQLILFLGMGSALTSGFFRPVLLSKRG